MPLRPLIVAVLAGLLVGCATSPTAPLRPSPPIDNPRATELVVLALAHIDTPYRFGGNDAVNGFDCSGFTRHLYLASLGIELPRRSQEQALKAGLAPVPRDALQPGDLVFFNTLSQPHSHVGLYIGEGRFVHAPRAGAAVRIEAMGGSYWSGRFDGARRPVVPAAVGASAGSAPQP
jgi:cell wall-associated NlpC family hydrolase